MTTEPLFRMEGVSKRYGGVVALAEAELAVRSGRIHAVLGENGAGKSTLIKIMSGVVQPDGGTMTLDGRTVAFPSPAAASDAGIVCVFQELSLVPDHSVADNIGIRRPPTRRGMIDRRAQRRLAEEARARAGAADIHPLAMVKDLPLSRRQMVEIAKALAQRPRILILDEATSALTAADVEKVFGVLKRLRSEGLALVYISHRMHEIEALADECTVFRNGRNVATYAAGTRTDQEVVEMMIGREYSHVFPPRKARAELPEPVLACRGLTWTDRLRDISFEVGRGEVVGLGGLDGQGQRELLLALFGVLRDLRGNVEVAGREARIPSPTRARALGMALIPEDRKTEGLALVYISHRMHEIAELADECTVFRNGRNVATYTAGTRSDQEVVEMMIGREYSHVFPPRTARAELPETVLAARGLTWTDRLRNVSFEVGRGEVVGLGGLDGQGQRDLLLALFGVLRDLKGTVEVSGREVRISSPTQARAPDIGMALIPEDRKTEGLMLPMTVGENLSFAAFDRIAPHGIVNRAAEAKLIDEMVKLLGIRTAGPDIPVGALSGGNQQKVVIAKWLMNRPRIILLNDPTRGIDGGTKQEIYQLLRGLADAGAAILFYSTDYAELIGCCDRVLVMYDGAVIRELAGPEITERALIASALNIPDTAA
jgi:ribose transport system ATP-binding protein